MIKKLSIKLTDKGVMGHIIRHVVKGCDVLGLWRGFLQVSAHFVAGSLGDSVVESVVYCVSSLLSTSLARVY